MPTISETTTMKIRSLVLGGLLAPACITAQPQLVKQWDFRYGGDLDDYVVSTLATPDQGLILAGFSKSGVSGDKSEPNWDQTVPLTFDYWVIRIDSTGSKVWDKRFGGTDNDQLAVLRATSDGAWVLGGFSQSGQDGDKTQPSQGFFDYWIVKMNDQGNKLWDRRYGGQGNDLLATVVACSDGGFLLAGYSNSPAGGDKTDPSQGGNDYWIVRTDSAGNKIWDRRYGGTASDALDAAIQTADGGFLLAGSSASDAGGDKSQGNWGVVDYWIVKTDSTGAKQWDRRFGGTLADQFVNDVVQTADGGFLFGGTSHSGSTGDKTAAGCGGGDAWLVRTDGNGVKMWDMAYGANDQEELYHIQPAAGGGFLLSCESYSHAMPGCGKSEDNLGVEQGWIVAIDSAGTMLWDKTVFTLGHDEYMQCLASAAGCYTVAISTPADTGGYKSQYNWSINSGTNDFWIVRLCDTAVVASGGAGPERPDDVTVYPNPFETGIRIVLPEPPSTVMHGTVRDVTGRLVHRFTTGEGEASRFLDLSFLRPGVYVIDLETDRGRIRHTVVRR